MIVSDLLQNKYGSFPDHIISCDENDVVANAIAKMANHKIGAVVISNDQGVAGVFSERDVIRLLNGQEADFRSTKLSDVMTKNVVGVTVTQTAEDALNLMKQHGIRHLTVMDNKELVGFLSLRDLMLYRIEYATKSAQFLKDQIASQSDPLPM